MIGKLALFVLAAMATTTLAFADPINGTQQRISPALRQIFQLQGFERLDDRPAGSALVDDG